MSATFTSNRPISSDPLPELLGLIRLLASIAHTTCDETPIAECKDGACAHAVAVLRRYGWEPDLKIEQERGREEHKNASS